MHLIRRTLLGATTLLTFGAAAVSAGAAGPTLPQTAAASSAATWLSTQLTPGDYIAGANPGTADLAATVNTLLALAATGTDPTGAQTGLKYMEHHQAGYVKANGSNGPGQVSLLILLAHALGVSPTDFGGTNLVAELMATEQSTGRFGTQSQVNDYNSGPYDQGLALAALAAAGDQLGTSALPVTWLQAQQCADGGWTDPSKALNPCDGSPADFAGPDTNTTAVAVEGLVAQSGGLTTTVSKKVLTFFESAQDSDAGWSYDPNSAADPQTTDPDSTSLVLQALVAMKVSPTSARFTKSGATPVSTLLTFQITSGADTGAISFTAGGTTGDLLSTYQTVPALAGLAIPYTAP
jgi:hypothetical protein